jgi:hypothetical protein
MSTCSSDPDSAFAKRPMPAQYEPNALDLAKVAAALDPRLSKEHPAKAASIAWDLISAAQDCLNKAELRYRDEVDYWERTREERERARLFPSGECVSLSAAFERWAGKFKTLGGFANALRKQRLTVRGSKNEELTSRQAVDEFVRRRKQEEKARDRMRKAKAIKKNIPKNCRVTGEPKPEQLRPKRER